MSNYWVKNDRDLNWSCAGPSPDAVNFHRTLPGYQPTELIDLAQIAHELGVGRVLAKNEAGRLGLPAFKALGASWAINQALKLQNGNGPFTIVTATDGNHGRAVAKFARLFGHSAKIVIPPGVHESAIQAIRDEGAQVSRVTGTYDDAVEAAAKLATEPNHILVQDTAWDGYEQVPTWIVEGYATMFVEIDNQLKQIGLGNPDLVIVPAGVGSLLQGALQHYRSKESLLSTKVISVEPVNAACVQASVQAGKPMSVPTSTTVMAGLNCGTISTLAWPYVNAGLDGSISITDGEDIVATKDLAKFGVAAGPCGGSGFAGLRKLLTGPDGGRNRSELGITDQSTLVILITEGADANPVPD